MRDPVGRVAAVLVALVGGGACGSGNATTTTDGGTKKDGATVAHDTGAAKKDGEGVAHDTGVTKEDGAKVVHDTGVAHDTGVDTGNHFVGCSVTNSQTSLGPQRCVTDTPLLLGGAPSGLSTCTTANKGTVLHRTNDATECPTLAAAFDAGACADSPDAAPDFCRSNADCTLGSNGTCMANGPGMCACASGCLDDSQCSAGEACVCGAGTLYVGPAAGVVVGLGGCDQASCKTDSDCGTGFLCVVSSNYSSPGSQLTCQSASDTCTTDADCQGTGNCDYVACSTGMNGRSCMGIGHVGRPFLVDGEARVAPVARATGWTADGAVGPDVRALTPEERARLAETWTRAGQMEHASVAAFARFALEMMALGAPADLLEATQSAMSDEIDHAKRAFALASAYAGRAVGPGRLDVSGALASAAPARVLSTLVREGCIGETFAAVDAAEALDHATDAAVRETLAVILRDETAHAALAFRAARWIVGAFGDEMRAVLRAEVAEARRGLQIGTPSEASPALAAHGVVSAARSHELRRAALASVVGPLLDSVAAPAPAAPAGASPQASSPTAWV